MYQTVYVAKQFLLVLDRMGTIRTPQDCIVVCATAGEILSLPICQLILNQKVTENPKMLSPEQIVREHLSIGTAVPVTTVLEGDFPQIVGLFSHLCLQDSNRSEIPQTGYRHRKIN